MAESDSNDSDFEYDSEDDDYNEIVYEPEEPCKTRFVIALCQLFNNRIHGPGPQGNYLVYCKYKKLDMNWIGETGDFMKLEYQYLHNLTHDLHPNYRQIVSTPNYIKPEIVECIYLKPDDHCIAIIKTFWIKIIQRTWRSVLNKRLIIKKSISGLRHREVTGTWPSMPFLRAFIK
jgi:hypothetical protein